METAGVAVTLTMMMMAIISGVSGDDNNDFILIVTLTIIMTVGQEGSI